MRIKKLYILPLLSFLLLATSCRHQKVESTTVSAPIDLKNIISSDTLRVATMYGSTSYFLFRDETMGFDYEMAGNLAKHLHLNLKISIAKSENEMFQWLRERKVDIISYNIIETKALKKQFSFVLPQPESYQVLVQNIGANSVSDVTELNGESIYVKENSIFHQRLKALNDEIGGTINIVLAPDSLSEDDLIDMVPENKIKFTLAYHNVATLHKSYYRGLDCRMPVGFNQRNGWLIREESHNLKNAIENWAKTDEAGQIQSELFRKYWEKSPFFALRRVTIPKGSISPFDHLFRKYAPNIDWDWRLVASIAFHESRFDSEEVSWSGAAGLMQLMPRTAANFGLNRHTVFDPEMNIEAGVQYIKSLNMSFRQISNKEERIKFVLAAYNSGPAHILDAMALARKYGKNPHIWFNNVEYFLIKKSEPEFYNDPVVKYGYFGGKETARYVKNTLDTYSKYSKRK
jgi:membrane-bound lytic murein transglycosylase F